MIIAITSDGAAASNEKGSIQGFDRCKVISDDALRLSCLKELMSPSPPSSQTGAPTPQGWRLIRTPDPQGGPDAISIVHVADLVRSSPEIAGLMVRCQRAAGIEVLIALVKPLSLSVRPNVRLTTGGIGSALSGTVVPPGSAILLPLQAESWVNGLGQNPTELTIVIDDDAISARGVVPIDDFSTALSNLTSNCSRPKSR